MLHDVVVIWPGSCNNVVPVHGDCALVRCRNMLQHGGQTCTTCCSQQCCDLLHSNVAIAWLELANARPTMLGYVVLRCCDHLAGASVTNTQHFDNLLSPISNANGRSLVLGACNQIACPYFCSNSKFNTSLSQIFNTHSPQYHLLFPVVSYFSTLRITKMQNYRCTWCLTWVATIHLSLMLQGSKLTFQSTCKVWLVRIFPLANWWDH